MPFDVFAARDEVVAEYGDYLESFTSILDDRVAAFLRGRLDAEELGPPVLPERAAQTRYTVPPEARREILRRLLGLNLRIAAEATSPLARVR